MWASNADTAPYGIVFARTGEGRAGISAFIVESDLPGVSTRPIHVIRDHHSAELVLDSCEVPAANLLGAEGQGFDIAQQWLVRGRIRIAAHCVGLAEESLRMGIEWANERETFGAKLSTRQAVQFALADIRVEINAARHLVWEAAWALDQGRDGRTAGVDRQALRDRGGPRAVDELGHADPRRHGHVQGTAARALVPRACGVWRVGDGPSEVHRMLIARELLEPEGELDDRDRSGSAPGRRSGATTSPCPRWQVEQGHLDYLIMDFLAELTMSILQKQKLRDPELGFAADIVPILRDTLPAAVAHAARRSSPTRAASTRRPAAEAVRKVADGARPRRPGCGSPW